MPYQAVDASNSLWSCPRLPPSSGADDMGRKGLYCGSVICWARSIAIAPDLIIGVGTRWNDTVAALGAHRQCRRQLSSIDLSAIR